MVKSTCPRRELGLVSRLQVTLATLALTLVLGATLLGPDDARAATDGGFCTNLPSQYWCGGANKHDFYYLQDHETYIGSVQTCLKGVKNNNSFYVYSCGYTPFATTFSRCGCTLTFYFQNLANGPRTLYGIGKY